MAAWLVAHSFGTSLFDASAGRRPELLSLPDTVAAHGARRGSPAGRAFGQRPTSRRACFVSELRFGFSAQDPWGNEGRRLGEPHGRDPLRQARSRRPISSRATSSRAPISAAASTSNGRTSFAYAGLTWTIDVTSSIFVEGSFGGAVHNGDTSPFEPPLRPGQPSAVRRCFANPARSACAVGELERHGDDRASLECRRCCGPQPRPDNVGARSAHIASDARSR